jgi:hypothetical protein
MQRGDFNNQLYVYQEGVKKLIRATQSDKECFTGAKHSSIPAETFISLNSITR